MPMVVSATSLHLEIAVTSKIHIITSCTDGKRASSQDSLHLAAHRYSSMEWQFRKWWHALCQDDAQALPAEDLYRGDHWTVSRDSLALAQAMGWKSQLWVISAGYGLVPVSARLRPYAATFQSGHADSVSLQTGPERIADHQGWWRLLTEVPGPAANVPRSIASLVRADPTSVVLVVASHAYLLAIEPDLLAARGSSQDSLFIVSSSWKGLNPELASSWIVSDARFQPLVQGSMVSLHARVARWLIQESPKHRFQMAEIQDLVHSYLKLAQAPPRHNRDLADDDTIRTFIRHRIATDERATHSGLLREWRRAGRACEQGRFRQLFKEIRGIH